VTDTHAQGSSGRPSPHRSGGQQKSYSRAGARARAPARHTRLAGGRQRIMRWLRHDASPARRERTFCFLRFAPALPWILLQLRSCTPCFHLGKGTGGERLTDISRKIWTHHSASVDWPVAAVSDNRSAMDDPYGGQQRQVCAVAPSPDVPELPWTLAGLGHRCNMQRPMRWFSHGSGSVCTTGTFMGWHRPLTP